MSGVIPDSIITVSTPITQNGWPEPYRIISFPSRVKVTGLSFTVDASAVDSKEDERWFYLAAVKGKRTVEPGADSWLEDIVPFFGDQEKPSIIYDQGARFVSEVRPPVDKYEWYTVGDSYVADVAQMDTDEYLTVWVYQDGGYFPEEFDWAATTATISISYTGATNLD
jgi:hypothetical protein